MYIYIYIHTSYVYVSHEKLIKSNVSNKIKTNITINLNN